MLDFKTEYREKQWIDPFPQYAKKHVPKKYPVNEEIRKIRELQLSLWVAFSFGHRKQMEAQERELDEFMAVQAQTFVALFGDGHIVLINGEPWWIRKLRK